jgi:hypothetical protein
MSMLKLQTWIVCESSGRWSAAFRIAFAGLRNNRIALRLSEVRSLSDLKGRVDERPYDLILVEVGESNLAEVLETLNNLPMLSGQFVALVDDTICGAMDVLWEAGAIEVVESPRQLRGLLAIGNRIAAAKTATRGGPAERQSIADWAPSMLPWQDT